MVCRGSRLPASQQQASARPTPPPANQFCSRQRLSRPDYSGSPLFVLTRLLAYALRGPASIELVRSRGLWLALVVRGSEGTTTAARRPRERGAQLATTEERRNASLPTSSSNPARSKAAIASHARWGVITGIPGFGWCRFRRTSRACVRAAGRAGPIWGT